MERRTAQHGRRDGPDDHRRPRFQDDREALVGHSALKGRVAIAFDLDCPVRSLSYLAAHSMGRGRRVRFFSGNPTASLFAELGRWVAAGVIRPQVDRVFPLAGIAAAHRTLEQGGVRGKIIVQIA